MSEIKLIEAAKNGDINSIEALLDNGENIEQKDDYGWTALNWAAGQGHTDIIGKLLESGADITNVGRDKRTALQIALAAGHVESASALQQAARQACIDLNETTRPYCKAYILANLKQFPDWPIDATDLTDDMVVFLHQDFSVSRSIVAGKEPIFDKPSAAWEVFCTDQLGFKVPTDLDLAREFAASKSFDSSQQPL